MRLGPLPDWVLALAHRIATEGLCEREPDQVVDAKILRSRDDDEAEDLSASTSPVHGMPNLTNAAIDAFFADGPVAAYSIRGVENTLDSTYLGVVGLSNTHLLFHRIDAFPFSGELSPTSRFLVRTHRSSCNEPVLVIVFRQFDSSQYQDYPEELIAGWFPGGKELEAAQCVADMNAHIDALRKIAAQAGFQLRVRFDGTCGALAHRLERILNCRFESTEAAEYGGHPAFEAQALGLRVWLVEFPPVEQYPRRFNFAGIGKRADLPGTVSQRDLAEFVQESLRHAGIDAYAPSIEERMAEAGLSSS